MFCGLSDLFTQFTYQCSVSVSSLELKVKLAYFMSRLIFQTFLLVLFACVWMPIFD